MTWKEYETGLEDRIRDLHSRVPDGSTVIMDTRMSEFLGREPGAVPASGAAPVANDEKVVNKPPMPKCAESAGDERLWVNVRQMVKDWRELSDAVELLPCCYAEERGQGRQSEWLTRAEMVEAFGQALGVAETHFSNWRQSTDEILGALRTSRVFPRA